MISLTFSLSHHHHVWHCCIVAFCSLHPRNALIPDASLLSIVCSFLAVWHFYGAALVWRHVLLLYDYHRIKRNAMNTMDIWGHWGKNLSGQMLVLVSDAIVWATRFNMKDDSPRSSLFDVTIYQSAFLDLALSAQRLPVAELRIASLIPRYSEILYAITGLSAAPSVEISMWMDRHAGVTACVGD
jgi:hypothetical protein